MLVYNLRLRPCIILFAKSPVPGRVKTRLQPFLAPSDAAALYTAFVSDMIERLVSIAGVELELHTNTVTDAWNGAGVTTRLQAEGDLELKMFHALEGALSAGHPRAMIVGSDAPTLPVSHMEALLASKADVALGPSTDGGYYAVSSRVARADMFKDVPWSSPLTLDLTVAALGRCGFSVELGPEWFDVDEPADLERLAASPNLPRRTKEWLLNHGR
jgi:rSAM/selenodomain-associated transferase 1